MQGYRRDGAAKPAGGELDFECDRRGARARHGCLDGLDDQLEAGEGGQVKLVARAASHSDVCKAPASRFKVALEEKPAVRGGDCARAPASHDAIYRGKRPLPCPYQKIEGRRPRSYLADALEIG